ncbi:hypothetical protein [Allomeiothermus silvanus]|uniref:hypothetical protein n=1 Tax=Allomeiothermus silvanus TaxID=52022 RepID=UPI00019E9C1A|nr:hypothetical protein [Allomeiothermus silvanus]
MRRGEEALVLGLGVDWVLWGMRPRWWSKRGLALATARGVSVQRQREPGKAQELIQWAFASIQHQVRGYGTWKGSPCRRR